MYVLLHEGEGNIKFILSSARVVSQTPGRMLVYVVPKNTGIWLQILATNSTNPIRNIRQYGLKLFAYEGGAGLESSRMPADKETQITALFQAVNRNPRMREVYLKYSWLLLLVLVYYRIWRRRHNAIP